MEQIAFLEQDILVLFQPLLTREQELRCEGPRVMFEGKVGRSSKGDICLDDITFSPECLLASSAGEEDNTPPPPTGTHSFPLFHLC